MLNIGPPKTLVILRHGRSVHNDAKEVKEGAKKSPFYTDEALRDKMRLIPDHRIPLADRGRIQAIEAGRAFKKRFGVPDEVIHSGFLRTEETTDGLLLAYDEAERANIKVGRDHRLRERDAGYCYNLTETEVARYFPWHERYWKETSKFFARPPGGESRGDVVDRVESAVKELWFGTAGRTTVWVTHGITTLCLRFHLEDLTYAAMETIRWPDNCGMVAYEFRDGRPILIAENEPLCTS